MSEVAERIAISPPHSCEVCKSADYQRAEIILKRGGLSPDNWGYLLHDMARALRGELNEIEWQLKRA